MEPKVYVASFMTNCPKVRMNEEEKEELRRLFRVAISDALRAGREQVHSEMEALGK